MSSSMLRNMIRISNRLLEDENVLLRFGLLLAFLSAIPMFAQSAISPRFHLPPFQVVMYNTYLTDVSYRDIALLLGACCVPMLFDTIFDIVETARGREFMKSSLLKVVQEDETTRVKITRLNAQERIIYLLGVTLQVLVLFTFNDVNDERIIVYNFVRDNCAFYTGKLMSYIAVMCFLQRCTITWTPLRTFFAVTLVGVGVICKNMRYTVGDPDIRSMVNTTGSSLMSISFGIQIICIFICLFGYMKNKSLTTTAKENNDVIEKDELHDRIQALDEFYTNYIPAGHMIVLFIEMAADTDFMYDVVADYQYWDVTINLSALFVLTIFIIVMESRIKHNEVVRVMLRSLLVTKNSYEQRLHFEKAQEEAHRAQEDAKKAEMDREREHRLRQELQENIGNSAHDIKSPTTALGLAVESLLDAFDNKESMTKARHSMIVETLQGMVHTISALNMIINRSVDASKTATSRGRGFFPNKGPVDVGHIMDDVMAFSKWQAEGTGIEVIMEPFPNDLPDEIMMDEKWLKDDLLCLASNAVKFSRTNQKVPAVMRVAILPSPTEEKANHSSMPTVQFTFIDSGYPLSDERLMTIFNRPSYSDRTQTGGLGLGLFCLSEHINALQGQYGARKRSDGHEGTEIWFSIPLILPDEDLDSFVMNDMGYDSHGPKTHRGQKVNAENDKPFFSSPQTRKTSFSRSLVSQKSQSSLGNKLERSTRSTQETHPNISSVGVPVGTSTVNGAIAVDADNSSIHLVREEKRFHRRSSAERMTEMIGSLPILLVDDSISILKMTKKAIQNECANISFMEAKNGEEAFERVLEAMTSFELIITDVQMPICNGFEFTRKVRQLERDKGLTPKMIVGISANDQQNISAEAKESGMDGFMHKPFKLSTLMDVIEDIIDRRKQTLLQKILSKDRDQTTTKSILPVSDHVGYTDLVQSIVGNSVSNAFGSNAAGGNNGLFVGKKILIVDDAISILKLMTHTLKNKAEAIVTQAKDGQQAVEECEKQNFDLILTDIQMPVLDGFGEAKCIRAMEKERGLPRQIIVGISANTQESMAVDAEEAGMDAFMNKPFKLEELTAVYVKLIEGKNRRDQPTFQRTLTSDVDFGTDLKANARGPRSIRNVTPNAKIFVDANELDKMLASQVGGDDLLLTVAVATENVEAALVLSPLRINSRNGMISDIKHDTAKVYIE